MWAEGLQLVLVLLLILSGVHRSILWWESRRRRPLPIPPELVTSPDLPRVLVQVPVYNDAPALRSLLHGLSHLEYPSSLLQIQVLDDSNDGTADENADQIQALAEEGIPVTHLHRVHRDGFKAGALAAGLRSSEAEFVAIFDADFQIPKRFLLQTLPHFEDDRTGWVQSRWGYLNRDENWLTRAQARLLDGHFRIEHRARSHGERFFNFNGTAGIWRRAAIDDAGGWSGETVVEDTDLSLRAWDRGWRGVYRDDIVCPGSLPADFHAFRTQQRRWLAGAMQLLLKGIPRRGSESVWSRFDLHARSLSPLVSFVVLGLMILAPLRRVFPETLGPDPWMIRVLGTASLEGTFFLFAFAGVLIFYASTGGGRISRWPESALVLLLGTGFAMHAVLSCCGGILGQVTTFERTPKEPGATGGRRVSLWEWGLLPLLAGLLVASCLAGAVSVLPLVGMGFAGLLWSVSGLGTGRRKNREWNPSSREVSSPCRNVTDSVV